MTGFSSYNHQLLQSRAYEQNHYSYRGTLIAHVCDGTKELRQCCSPWCEQQLWA